MDFSVFFPMWSKLTEPQRQALASAAVSRNCKKGEMLYTGTDCTGLILVRSGQLRIFSLSEEGREITLYRLFDRDICLFSASCMMQNIQFNIAVSAEKQTEIFVIPADLYRGIMAESAPLANYTNEVMASRFSEVMWLMEQILWKSFDKRLAEFLLNEASTEGNNALSLTHETIGNHLGNPREVVTRMLKYFQSEGMVRLARGTVEIADAEKLRRITEE